MSLFFRHSVARLGLVSSLALVLGLAAAGKTEAGLVTYTLTGGTIGGTLNGVAFSNANFTITAQADPNAFVNGSIYSIGQDYPIASQAATSIMSINGFDPFEFTDPNFGIFALNLSAIVPDLYYAGFGYQADATTLHGFAAVGFPTTDPFSGNLAGADSGITYATTGGDLVIDTVADNGATFSGPIAVPEPGTLVMAGLVAVGGGLVSFRRLRRQVVAA